MTQRLALVTGATGGLGRHVVQKLLLARYRVRASGRNERIGRELGRAGAAFAPGDLRDEAHVGALARNVDVIFHCAALSAPWGKRIQFQNANVDVTRSLVDAAAENRCQRFVHISSPSIYFDFKDQLGIREDDEFPSRFVNDYAATKAEAERIVQAAGGEGLATFILRPRGIFGEHDSVLVPRLLDVARGGRMPVFNNGKAMVDVTYAGNVADAMLLCDRPAAPPGIYNITNGEPVTVRDLLQRVFRAVGRDVRLVPVPYNVLHALAGVWEWVARILDLKSEPRILRYSLGLMNYSQTLDITAARTQLGYSPEVSIDEGLARFARWYRCDSGIQRSDNAFRGKGSDHETA